MITIADITQTIEAVAPLDLQEAYDNAGLINGDQQAPCTGVICTLDATEAVIDEAISKGCNLVVSHHPILFRAIKHIRPDDYVRKTLIKAVKNDIAVYAAHTNLDNVVRGVNGRIADKLHLIEREVVLPSAPGIGSGVIGKLPVAISATEFLTALGNEFNPGLIRYNGLKKKQIARVAVCGGAGSFLISKALAMQADAFVTSDLKYHEFFDAGDDLLLCDIGHFESEQFTMDLFVEILLGKFRNFAVLKSEVTTNPVHYFTGK